MSETPSATVAAEAPRTTLTPTGFVSLLQQENPGNIEDAILRGFFIEFPRLINAYRAMLSSSSQISTLLGDSHPRCVLIQQALRIMDEVSPPNT